MSSPNSVNQNPDVQTVNRAALVAEGVSKTYHSVSGITPVLEAVSFEVKTGHTCAIVGPSGSGKTTLLGLCAGLDVADAGTIRLAGQDLAALDEEGRATFRRRNLGFIFQNFQLIPTLTALENVMVPLELLGQRDASGRARELLARVGLGDRLTHRPAQLSGGEQQRVAFCRAFVHQPSVLLADEPTGNLDAETGAVVADLLFSLNRDQGTTLILVTHDLDLAARCGQQVRLKAGRVVAP
jgi:putative ABC transport system ATP-binding protein